MRADMEMIGKGAPHVRRFVVALGICLMLCVPLISVSMEDVYAPSTTVVFTFDCDGGTGGPGDISLSVTIASGGWEDFYLTVPETVPVKEGYVFSYWSFETEVRIISSPSGAVINPGDMIVGHTNENTVILKAVWAIPFSTLVFLSDPITDGTVAYAG